MKSSLKGGDGGNIQVMGATTYFVVNEVELIGVSDHCEKKPIPFPPEYILIFSTDWIPFPAPDL